MLFSFVVCFLRSLISFSLCSFTKRCTTFLQAILNFFKQFIDSISTDLQFVIDDISEEDTSAVGVTWHLGWVFIIPDCVIYIYTFFFSLFYSSRVLKSYLG